MRKRLVVVTVIGLLAGIAISQFAAYRQRGYDAQANTDLRNAASCRQLLRLVSTMRSTAPPSSATLSPEPAPALPRPKADGVRP